MKMYKFVGVIEFGGSESIVKWEVNDKIKNEDLEFSKNMNINF